MKELLTYIVQNLVEKPDEVSVTEREANGETVFEVRVADGDMGKVIGRQGRIVKEIRILMKAVAQRKGKKVSVEIMDCRRKRAAPVQCVFCTYTQKGGNAYAKTVSGGRKDRQHARCARRGAHPAVGG